MRAKARVTGDCWALGAGCWVLGASPNLQSLPARQRIIVLQYLSYEAETTHLEATLQSCCISKAAALPESVVRAAQQGERSAQQTLYERYAATLFAVSRRYARDQPEAEDFAQEAWVRIFRKLHTFRFGGSLEGWLRRVTVTVALRGIEKRGTTFDELPRVLPEDFHVDAEAIARLNADDLLQHIEALPEGYKIVFNLHAVEGYSHDEIAQQLNINASTSRSQLTKARKLLQKRLANLLPLCL